MKHSVVQKLLSLYPAKWRHEYGAELEDLLLAEPLRFPVILNVVGSALRQQVRPANHPAGLVRLLARVTAGVAGLFIVCMTLSVPLWQLITRPMIDALMRSGRPPRLIQHQPFEGFAILWLGLPLLLTAFVGYPCLLYLIRSKLAPSWTPQAKRSATAFVICSGSLGLLSGVSGLIAWQHGVVLTLRGFEPLMPPASITTLSACFGRFARSILEFGFLVQIPVLALFLPRLRSAVTPARTR